jgi:hypothetical protein
MLIAGAHAAVDLRVATWRVFVFPPPDALDQFLSDFARARAARKRVLDAVNFRRFREDAGTAVTHQQIDGGPEGRIRSDR